MFSEQIIANSLTHLISLASRPPYGLVSQFYSSMWVFFETKAKLIKRVKLTQISFSVCVDIQSPPFLSVVPRWMLLRQKERQKWWVSSVVRVDKLI